MTIISDFNQLAVVVEQVYFDVVNGRSFQPFQQISLEGNHRLVSVRRDFNVFELSAICLEANVETNVFASRSCRFFCASVITRL